MADEEGWSSRGIKGGRYADRDIEVRKLRNGQMEVIMPYKDGRGHSRFTCDKKDLTREIRIAQER